MTVAILGYDHNAYRFGRGDNKVTDDYRVVLLADTAIYDPSHTTLAEVTDSGADEVYGNGWAQGGELLGGVTVTQVNTDDAKWTADTLSTLITGGTLTFRNYCIYHVTDLAPVAFIQRTSDIVFNEDAYNDLTWPADGILALVAPAS